MFMLLERDVVLLPLLRQLTYVQVASKKQSILTPVLSHFPYALANLIQATFWLVLMNCIPPCSLPCLPHRMRFCLYCPEVLSDGDHRSVHCCVCEDQIRAPRSI